MTQDTPRWQRVFAVQNLISVLLGVAVFLVGLRLWDTTLGVFLSAVAASLASGLVWLLWWYRRAPTKPQSTLDAVHLGTVADHGQGPAPTLAEPASRASDTYRELLAAIDAQTTGQILIVSATEPGAGASTVAMNLAIAATQLGRRVVLIDGNFESPGISRYSRSGTSTGLTDIASGEATLAEASQMWTVGNDSLLPVVTAGTHGGNDAVPFDGVDLAAAFDVIGERADLVLIDAPPISNGGPTAKLAAHADGSILVVGDAPSADSLIAARDGLAEAGAPVIGFVSDRTNESQTPWLRMLKRSAAAFAIISLVYLGFTAVLLWSSWNGIERETLDTAAARAIGSPMPDPPTNLVTEGEGDTPPIEDVVIAQSAPAGTYRSFLLIGSDETAGLADVILLTVLPADGSDPFMVSLPRDLYIPNRCTNGYTRINATLNGCGDVNGPTALSLAVEDFTGITVDHFALFDFDGFANIIDGVGGVEICVDYERSDWRAGLQLPAGCSQADGATALAWVRSRHPREKVNGAWRAVPGASDLLRNRAQQEVLLQLLGRLNTFDSPADLARKIDELSEAFTLDDGLGIADGLALAWSLRGLVIADVRRIEIPVVFATTDRGQSVLRATQPFDEVLAELYPGLLEAAGPESN
ncbi:MAG: hypothetical protein BMS9Abin07_0841 [Acidimicrobiia bacterium]|nr:MAG: hypothetical protein BMS9Abin07_0841 [Acidimicrobiia bacterium]